jgi:hypothetical protein
MKGSVYNITLYNQLNVNRHSSETSVNFQVDYTASYPRRQNSLYNRGKNLEMYKMF